MYSPDRRLERRVRATFMRAPDLIWLQKGERSWMTNAFNPRRPGNVIANST